MSGPASASGTRRKRASTASNPGRLNAGLGGAGGGAALIAIAQHLGADSWPGLILMYCAPAIAVGYGGVIAQIQLRTESARRRSVAKEARKTIEKLLQDPHVSEEHKASVRSKLEELDSMVIDNHLSRVKALG